MAELLAQSYIRDVPDFPKEGILFKDIAPVLQQPAAMAEVRRVVAVVAQARGNTMASLTIRVFFACSVFGYGAIYLMGQAPKGEKFRIPETRISTENRIVPNPKWITTKFDAKEDIPFQKVALDYEQFKVFAKRDTTGIRVQKARKACKEWKEDCQNAIKLFRACCELGAARNRDFQFNESGEATKMWNELRHGFRILKDPPKSYHFIRMGYRMTTGDGERCVYSNLVNVLLAKDPADRPVLLAALREIYEEKPGYGGPVIPGKGKELEDLVLKGIEQLRKTKYWHPFDDTLVATVYYYKYMRTKDKTLLHKAIDYQERAIRAVPADFDKRGLLEGREYYKKALKQAG
jgi:hypothetical protein